MARQYHSVLYQMREMAVRQSCANYEQFNHDWAQLRQRHIDQQSNDDPNYLQFLAESEMWTILFGPVPFIGENPFSLQFMPGYRDPTSSRDNTTAGGAMGTDPEYEVPALFNHENTTVGGSIISESQSSSDSESIGPYRPRRRGRQLFDGLSPNRHDRERSVVLIPNPQHRERSRVLSPGPSCRRRGRPRVRSPHPHQRERSVILSANPQHRERSRVLSPRQSQGGDQPQANLSPHRSRGRCRYQTPSPSQRRRDPSILLPSKYDLATTALPLNACGQQSQRSPIAGYGRPPQAQGEQQPQAHTQSQRSPSVGGDQESQTHP